MLLLGGCTFEKQYNSLDNPKEMVINNDTTEIYAFTPKASEEEFEFSLDLSGDEAKCENQESVQYNLDKGTEDSVSDIKTVWVSSTGSKYHSKSECSNMKSPERMSLSQAAYSGYEPCKRCYKE